MINFDFSEYQKVFTNQVEKIRDLSEKAVKLNTEFAENAISRQTKLAGELVKTNTDFVKSFADLDNITDFKAPSLEAAEQILKSNEAYFTEIKDSLDTNYEENAASHKKYQANVEKLVTQMTDNAAKATAPIKAAAKKTAKAA